MAQVLQWQFSQRDIRLQFGVSRSAWPGTCFSLSYDWCKSVLSGRLPREGDYDVAKGHVWTITSQHRAYRDTPQGIYEWLTQLCRGDGLTLEPELTGANVDGAFAGIVDDDAKVPAGSAAIVGSGGHAMAFTKGVNSTGYFFDPNIGQYRVWDTCGAEIRAILNENDYEGAWRLRIMSGQPRDRQHYLNR